MLQQLSAMGFPAMTPVSFEARLAEAGGDFELLVAMLLTGGDAGDVREAMETEAALDDTGTAMPPPITTPDSDPPPEMTVENSSGGTAEAPATSTSAASGGKCPCPDCTCGPGCRCLENKAPQCDSCATFVKSPEGHAAAAAAVAAATGSISAKTATTRQRGPIEGEGLSDYLDRVGASPASAKTPAQYQAMTRKAQQGSWMGQFPPPG